MSTVGGKWDEDECSVIGDKGDIGFIDFNDDKSFCSYNPAAEGPIVISVPFPFVGGRQGEKPQSVVVGETVSDKITIENTTRMPVELWGVKIYASTPEDSFTLSLMEPPKKDSVEAVRAFLESTSLEDRVLQPGDTLTVWLSCKPKEIGMHTSVVQFDFEDNQIERAVFLLADDKISQSLASTRPFEKRTKKKPIVVDSYHVAVRPSRKTERRPFKNRLPRYDMPKELRDHLLSQQYPECVTEGLTRRNYADHFKTLLMIEEIQLEESMRSYDMEYVTLRRRGYHFLSLEVPGLAERRPSLVHGDHVFAKLSDYADDTTVHPYQGFIHRVEADEVYLKFAADFHTDHIDGNLYNVQFTYSRVLMRRLYQATDAAAKLDTGFLFPSESLQRRWIRASQLVPVSCQLNEEQICAVEMILDCKGGPPYVIHGPPGTGKTKTIVEAILQLYKNREKARILVCAPSNSAADHILEKLLTEKADVVVQENEIFRLNAPTRPYEDVKPDLIKFCVSEDFIFSCPPPKALRHYRIIISTYMSASLLYAEGIQKGHFSHIILDEAGQASEPETMIPIASLHERNTVVVLAGDPMQLGPIINSKNAEEYGLGISYLERMFQCEFYINEDNNYVTKLVRNYRCHPEILYLPNVLFYREELIACKDDSVSFIASLDLLPNKDFPVVFFGIQGCDEREGNNPSWFNRTEASKVVEVTKRLTAGKNMSEEDIGVITPYRQQVLKLKKAFEDLDMPDIKVGSVEQFQGQERQVIIISTVRSTIKHNEFDRTYCLGFLSNPKRFNVAITRAKSLLIIIGNPHIISKDPNWNKLLWRCADNSSYQGCNPPDRQEEFSYENQTQEDHWNNNEENSSFSRTDDWVQGSWETEAPQPIQNGDGAQEWLEPEVPQPVVDESEWSDGWK